MNTTPLDLSRLRVRPLEERASLTRVEDILLDPETAPPPLPERLHRQVVQCAAKIHEARRRGAGVILIYGAHLVRNGTARILGPDDGAGLDHAPRHQRRGHDPRLGIRVAGPIDRERAGQRGHRDLRLVGRDRPQHPPRAAGRRPGRRGLRPGAGPVHRRGRCRPARAPRCSRHAIRSEPVSSPDARPGRRAARHSHPRPAGGADHGRAPLEGRLDPGPGLPARGAGDRASRDRLRHHRQPSRCSTGP